MKRYGNIFEKIYSIDNLMEAHKKARRNKSHYTEVKMVNKDQEYRLLKIRNSLKNQTFTTSDYKVYDIFDGRKHRTIFKLPYYPDRIVQWAIMLQIEPIMTETLIFDTYASIPNKGIHLAVKRLKRAINTEGMYCLKLDVKQFFPSIDQDILLSLLGRKFKDRKLMWLLEDIIKSTPYGLPIGNYTSQWFANFYLAYFDHMVKEDLKLSYFRYMDDMISVSRKKESLWDALNKISDYLNYHLNLQIKDNYQVFPIDARGIDFLGYRIYKDHIFLRKSISKKIKRKFHTIKKRHKITKSDMRSMTSYKGWVDFCTSKKLKQNYIQPVLEGGIK